MTDVMFMSQQHVDEMNRLLAADDEVRSAAAALGTQRILVYELTGGPAGETLYWPVSMGPDGMWFSLGPPVQRPDIVIRCDWRQLISSLHAFRNGEPAIEVAEDVTGDDELLGRMQAVLATGRQVATVPARLPSL